VETELTISIIILISGTKITIPFNANCSITKKAFSGNIIIEYYPSKKVIEYVDMGEVIKEITNSRGVGR